MNKLLFILMIVWLAIATHLVYKMHQVLGAYNEYCKNPEYVCSLEGNKLMIRRKA